MDTYTASDIYVDVMAPMGLRPLASGSVAVTDYDGRVLRITSGAEAIADEYDGLASQELSCWVCDGLGHAYTIGWRHFDNGTSQRLIGGGPCPCEG